MTNPAMDDAPRCPVCGERLKVDSYYTGSGRIGKHKSCPFGCYSTIFADGYHWFFVGDEWVDRYRWTDDADRMLSVQRKMWAEIRRERWRRLWWVLPVRLLRRVWTGARQR